LNAYCATEEEQQDQEKLRKLNYAAQILLAEAGAMFVTQWS
jgi:hypothetical protein